MGRGTIPVRRWAGFFFLAVPAVTCDNRRVAKNKLLLATYLVDKGLMTQEQVESVVREQAKALPGMRDQFGKIAVRMGFITAPVLEKAVKEKEKEESGK